MFLANIAAVIAIGAYGLSNGHPDRLLVGYDSTGRACGKDTLSAYPYVYMTSTSSVKKSLCLKTCPTLAVDSTIGTNKDVNNASAAAAWGTDTYVDTVGALRIGTSSNPVYTLNVDTYFALAGSSSSL